MLQALTALREVVRGHDELVFLCHSSGDKIAVRLLYHRLTSDGVRCWFDEGDLLPGQDWDHEINEAIRRSRYVLACLSAASITKTGYVQKELKRALDLADETREGPIFLIPARLEDGDVPRRLAHLHWVDLFRQEGYERLLKALRFRQIKVVPKSANRRLRAVRAPGRNALLLCATSHTACRRPVGVDHSRPQRRSSRQG